MDGVPTVLAVPRKNFVHLHVPSSKHVHDQHAGEMHIDRYVLDVSLPPADDGPRRTGWQRLVDIVTRRKESADSKDRANLRIVGGSHSNVNIEVWVVDSSANQVPERGGGRRKSWTPGLQARSSPSTLSPTTVHLHADEVHAAFVRQPPPSFMIYSFTSQSSS